MTTTTNTIDNNMTTTTDSAELTNAELWQIDRTGKNAELNAFVARLNADLKNSGLEADLVCDHDDYDHACGENDACQTDYDTRAEDHDVINYIHGYGGGRNADYIGQYKQERAYMVTLKSGDVCWIRYNTSAFSCLDFIIDDYDFGRGEGEASYWWHIESCNDYKDYVAGAFYSQFNMVSKDRCIAYLVNSGKSNSEICKLVGKYQDEDGAWWVNGEHGQTLCCDPKTATKIEDRTDEGDDCESLDYYESTIYQAPEGYQFEIGRGGARSHFGGLEEGSNNIWVGGSGCMLVD